MADFSKFRTSLNGFNRSDVVNYIETLCAEHRRELQEAKAQLAKCQDALAEEQARSAALKEELEQTTLTLEELLTAPDAPTEEPEVVEEAPDYAAMELAAYRRAEAMERTAAERSAQMQTQLNELLDHVASRYEQTGQDIQVLAQDIRTNLQRLEEALSDLDVIFDETNVSFEEMERPLLEI